MLFGKIKTTCICLVLLSLLPGCSNTSGRYKPSSSYDKSHVLKVARAQLGKKYHFGGKTPREGFDCSGLVYYSYKKAGVDLPRTSSAQYRASQPVSKPRMKPGDLLFFRINRSKISHVAIYLGNNRFIHAPSSGKQVSISYLDNPYWRKRFVRAGRVY